MQQKLNPAQEKLYNAILQHENITDKLEQLEVWNEVYYDEVDHHFVRSYRELGLIFYNKTGLKKGIINSIDIGRLGELYLNSFKDLINSHGLVYRRDE